MTGHPSLPTLIIITIAGFIIAIICEIAFIYDAIFGPSNIASGADIGFGLLVGVFVLNCFIGRAWLMRKYAKKTTEEIKAR